MRTRFELAGDLGDLGDLECKSFCANGLELPQFLLAFGDLGDLDCMQNPKNPKNPKAFEALGMLQAIAGTLVAFKIPKIPKIPNGVLGILVPGCPASAPAKMRESAAGRSGVLTDALAGTAGNQD